MNDFQNIFLFLLYDFFVCLFWNLTPSVWENRAFLNPCSSATHSSVQRWSWPRHSNAENVERLPDASSRACLLFDGWNGFLTHQRSVEIVELQRYAWAQCRAHSRCLDPSSVFLQSSPGCDWNSFNDLCVSEQQGVHTGRAAGDTETPSHTVPAWGETHYLGNASLSGRGYARFKCRFTRSFMEKSY